MARVKTIQKSRKVVYCMVGRHELPEGSAYYLMQPRYRGKMTTCTAHPFRASHRVGGKMSDVYAATEEFEDRMASLESHENMDYEDAAATGKECAETIQGVAEEYRESAEAIEEGFGHSTYQSDELNEKADEIEDYANTIQEAAEEIDSCFDTYSDADSTRDDAHDAHITATKELDEYRGEKDTTEYKSLAEAKSDKEDELDMAEQELDETGEALEEALESLQRAIAECPV